MSFKNQLSLITGAAKGIGAQVSLDLLKQGSKVIMLDIDSKALSSFAKPLQIKYPNKVYFFNLDLTDKWQVTQLLDMIEQDFGDINHLANCAGILHLNSILDITPEELEKTISVNMSGAFFMIQAIAKKMAKQGGGSIVAVGSNAASTPRKNMAAYCASKAGIHMLIRCLGLELAQLGIRCNIVSPGSTRTQMQTQMWNDNYNEQDTIAGELASFRMGIPLNKIAEPHDISDAVLFLLSDKAKHITMQDLRIDGGATLGCI